MCNVGAMFMCSDGGNGDGLRMFGDVGVKQYASFSTELKLAYDIEAKGLVGSVALIDIRIGDEGLEQHSSKSRY